MYHLVSRVEKPEVGVVERGRNYSLSCSKSHLRITPLAEIYVLLDF